VPPQQGVNLTVITGGSDNRTGTGPTVYSNQSGTRNAIADQPFTHAAWLSIPLRNYDRIGEFLIWLENEYDDPSCDFQQYSEVLTNEHYLGFRRICEVVDAVPQQDLPAGGGAWLKAQMIATGAPISLSDGTAHALFQGMWRKVQQIRHEWVSSNSRNDY
jgi:hypothetical protein